MRQVVRPVDVDLGPAFGGQHFRIVAERRADHVDDLDPGLFLEGRDGHVAHELLDGPAVAGEHDLFLRVTVRRCAGASTAADSAAMLAPVHARDAMGAVHVSLPIATRDVVSEVRAWAPTRSIELDASPRWRAWLASSRRWRFLEVGRSGFPGCGYRQG